MQRDLAFGHEPCAECRGVHRHLSGLHRLRFGDFNDRGRGIGRLVARDRCVEKNVRVASVTRERAIDAAPVLGNCIGHFPALRWVCRRDGATGDASDDRERDGDETISEAHVLLRNQTRLVLAQCSGFPNQSGPRESLRTHAGSRHAMRVRIGNERRLGVVRKRNAGCDKAWGRRADVNVVTDHAGKRELFE